jgi:hypothetical protein
VNLDAVLRAENDLLHAAAASPAQSQAREPDGSAAISVDLVVVLDIGPIERRHG